MTSITKRDKAEAALMNAFPDILMDLDNTSAQIIHVHKDGGFGGSYLSYQLYTNGHNQHSVSTHHPRGLLFNNGEVIFGVGIFFRPQEPETPCIHIVGPRGENWNEAMEAFVRGAEAAIPNALFFVRQLTHEQYIKIKPQPNLERILGMQPKSCWTAIDANPWLETAPQEDETFQDSVINLDEVLQAPEKGGFKNIARLSKNSRDGARRNFNGFNNFLNRNGLEYVLEPYTLELEGAARNLIQRHFQSLVEKGKAIGSTAADYENILTTSPDNTSDIGLHMWMGFIQPKGNAANRRAVSFYGFEELQASGKEKCCGGYATITTYDEEPLKGLIADITGHRNIATYASAMTLHALRDLGIKKVKLGGSETRDLTEGKQKIGAIANLTYWAVYSTANHKVVAR